MVNKVKLSKTMAYLLRHDPDGMDINKQGFAKIDDLLKNIKKRLPDTTKNDVKKIVSEDSKGRYEIKNNFIRARYGHSIDVTPDLEDSKINKLYHGTTRKAANNILKNGLKPKGRQKVHLSPSIQEAINVGKRRTNNPVVLEINTRKCDEMGIKIQKASSRVYVSDYIPPEYIELLQN